MNITTVSNFLGLDFMSDTTDITNLVFNLSLTAAATLAATYILINFVTQVDHAAISVKHNNGYKNILLAYPVAAKIVIHDFVNDLRSIKE
jgi:hypothetical protein